jgi:serine/threonine-protein kinase
MDFGIAKVLEAVHATNTQSIGTLQYMSPEQIDAKTIDARSDLYALGLILYEAIAGSPPFQSASPRELLNMQCTALPPPFGDDVRDTIPRGVEELVFALLEKAPGDRPGSAREVTDRLAPFRPAADRGPRASRASDKKPDTQRTPPPEKAPPSKASGAKAPADDTAEPPKKLDTVALVERATAPKEIPTGIAILVIVALSLVAGLATYVVRTRSGPSVGPPAVTTTTAARTDAKRP